MAAPLHFLAPVRDDVVTFLRRGDEHRIGGDVGGSMTGIPH
jgi:hypothetical protein